MLLYEDSCSASTGFEITAMKMAQWIQRMSCAIKH